MEGTFLTKCGCVKFTKKQHKKKRPQQQKTPTTTTKTYKTTKHTNAKTNKEKQDSKNEAPKSNNKNSDSFQIGKASKTSFIWILILVSAVFLSNPQSGLSMTFVQSQKSSSKLQSMTARKKTRISFHSYLNESLCLFSRLVLKFLNCCIN